MNSSRAIEWIVTPIEIAVEIPKKKKRQPQPRNTLSKSIQSVHLRLSLEVGNKADLLERGGVSVVDGGAGGDQGLDGVEGLGAVLDNVDLEARLLKTSLGSLDALSANGLGVVVVGEGSQLGVGLGKSGEGVADVGVLGVGRHFCGVCWVGWAW